MATLKQILDKLYREYDFESRLLVDPIAFPHQYKKSGDIEASGFIASCFAYGRVDLFKPVIKSILVAMGESPYNFLIGFDPKKQGNLFKGICYRFNKNADIVCLLYVLGIMLRKFGGIEPAFKQNYSKGDLNTGNGLTGLIDALTGMDTYAVYGKNVKTRGFLQFFPSPSKGSACKRMNLFLRWMIRDKDIDFGIWKGIPQNKLVIPLDTHIARISKCLGFTKRASQDWKAAVEITESLKKLDPDDPLKYDFALCHQGISRVCGKMRCKDCGLFGNIKKA